MGTYSKETTIMRSVLASLLLLAACGNDLEPGSTIDRVRVLGARVEVAGDPERASPAAGEEARVTWIVTSPDAMPTLSWAMGACVADAAMLDCASDPVQLGTGSGGVPQVTFTAPADADGLLVVGVICAGGMPEVDGGESRCVGAADAIKTDVRLSVPLGVSNHSPVLADDAIRLGDLAWSEVDAALEPALEGCAADAASLGIPVVSAAAQESIFVHVATRGADRETYTDVDDGAVREELQISHFTTAGELDHQFEIVEADDAGDAPVTEVEWTAPTGADLDDVPADGVRVRFTFVMRDGRGGVDSTRRVMCLVP